MPTASSSTLARAALAVGSEVPAGDFVFRVHSVFAAAMNLAVTGRRGLVALVGEGGDDLPQGIRLATRERFDAWPVHAGSTGRRTAGALVFGGEDGEEACVVDLAGATVAARALPPALDPAAAPVREAWAACASRLDGLQAEKAADLRLAVLCGRSAAPTPLGGQLAERAGALAAAVRASDADAAERAAARLLGLGGGLTPAGDDFLCGLFAALWCVRGADDPENTFVHRWGSRLASRLAATNDISATFLECAFAGCFPATVVDLAAAIGRSRAGDAHRGPREALDRLCALGHSSGMDTATGFLFGLWLRTDDETRSYAP